MLHFSLIKYKTVDTKSVEVVAGDTISIAPLTLLRDPNDRIFH